MRIGIDNSRAETMLGGGGGGMGGEGGGGGGGGGGIERDMDGCGMVRGELCTNILYKVWVSSKNNYGKTNNWIYVLVIN